MNKFQTGPGKSVIVVGGGVAGMSAACALAEAGLRVKLVERRGYLGGRASSYRHPGVGEVIGEGGERVRCAVVEAVSGRWPDYGLDEDTLPPSALVFLLGAIPRMVHLEEGLGTFAGHAETVAVVERFLDRVEPNVAD